MPLPGIAIDRVRRDEVVVRLACEHPYVVTVAQLRAGLDALMELVPEGARVDAGVEVTVHGAEMVKLRWWREETQPVDR